MESLQHAFLIPLNINIPLMSLRQLVQSLFSLATETTGLGTFKLVWLILDNWKCSVNDTVA